MHLKLCIVAVCLAAALTACATYKATLTNARGQSTTCERFGPSRLLSGYLLIQGLRKKFDDCFADARSRGFFEPAEN